MSAAWGWALLVASGLTDVAWAFATKRSNGFTEPLWSVVSLVLLAAFIAMLAKALQVLPRGPAYAVWTGVGAVGALAVGVAFLGEALDPVRICFAGVIVIGIAGLKLAG
ncbi:DMT family transporter [Chenggangzhangella methanolivorans]|uniref:Guanidinium exporter n=1 Tax=Chenggangzhangella methanolivorans TaxID=1437009 RepID=A0A9E6RCN7_9HYPH|nr:multidrug efflux SMR transporter [Chenggangzhangella methanolivorans]QZO01900.1 multidrug efflux SMR transporter [Chenggangzhangella methanolivorans]